MKSTAFILMIVTIISKVFGLLRQTTLSYLYGTGDVAEAFLTAQILPVLIIAFISSGISTGFIPTYNRIVNRHGEGAGDRFTSNVNNTVMVLMVFLIIICEIFAYPLVKIFAKGFTGYKLDLTVQFMRIALLSMLPSIVAAVFRGYLNAKNHFLVQNLQGYILNLFIIGSLILSAKFDNTWIIGIGLLLAISLQYIIYIPVVKKKGFRYRPGINLSDPYLRRLLLLAIPVILGTAVTQINVVIDNRIASVVSEKGVSVLSYAQRLTEFVNGIVITTIATVVFPELSRRVVKRDIDGLKDSILSSLSTISILVLPAMAGLMTFARPIVSLVFEHGSFTADDTSITSACLYMYAIGLIGIAVREIVSKTFYSLNDTKTPTLNSMMMVGINIVGNLTLSKIFGVKGLALATSLSSLIGAFTITLHLRRKIGRFRNISRFFVEIGKMLLATGLMVFGSRLVYGFGIDYLAPSGGRDEILVLFFAIITAVLIYGGAIVVLQVEELKSIVHGFLRRRKGRSNDIDKK
ncbi:MAG: murein biosynthesis integral membrane protein MurJ [Tissierellia bacterium]|nr:murein biosynthesis integral membrane protein MurJ [Tissierellia bacterium]